MFIYITSFLSCLPEYYTEFCVRRWIILGNWIWLTFVGVFLFSNPGEINHYILKGRKVKILLTITNKGYISVYMNELSTKFIVTNDMNIKTSTEQYYCKHSPSCFENDSRILIIQTHKLVLQPLYYRAVEHDIFLKILHLKCLRNQVNSKTHLRLILINHRKVLYDIICKHSTNIRSVKHKNQH